MLLKDIHIVGEDGLQQILVEGEKIVPKIEKEIVASTPVIVFENAMAFPGLINSHDHLDFNLFPKLSHGTYKNYIAWANDIQKNDQEIIKAVQRIPKPLGTQWGIYKNLLNGVTTVVDHGEKTTVETDLLTIYQDCVSLHSVNFEKKWKWQLNNPLSKNDKYVMHAGEGTDAIAYQEIDELIKNNFLKRKLIAIHGVVMDEKQAEHFKALTWCPETNFNLLKKTAAIDKLKERTIILFGTDSTLTANWNMWKHFRKALETKMVKSEELFKMVSTNAAAVWNLQNTGILQPSMYADIVIAKKMDLFDINPEDILMVVRKGDIKLFDEGLLDQMYKISTGLSNYSSVKINGATKYVKGDLPGLMNAIKEYYPAAVFPIQIDN